MISHKSPFVCLCFGLFRWRCCIYSSFWCNYI